MTGAGDKGNRAGLVLIGRERDSVIFCLRIQESKLIRLALVEKDANKRRWIETELAYYRALIAKVLAYEPDSIWAAEQ